MPSEIRAAAKEQSISYLARVVDILEALGREPAKTLSEVAAETGVPPSTAYRLLTLLVDRGFARRVDGSRDFVAGPVLERIGLRALTHRQVRLDDAASDIAHLTGESVSLGVVKQNEIVLASRHESSHPLRYVISVGDAVVIDQTAMGLVVLANSSLEQRRLLLSRLPEGGEEFLARWTLELECVRAQQFAIYEDSGGVVGLMCVAAPIFDGAGRISGALSVAGPTVRFSRRDAESTVPALQRVAKQLVDEFPEMPGGAGAAPS